MLSHAGLIMMLTIYTKKAHALLAQATDDTFPETITYDDTIPLDDNEFTEF